MCQSLYFIIKLGIKKGWREFMTQQEHMLKEKLIKIKDNNYLLEEDDQYFLCSLEMLENIGSLDPMLRDELIYGILFQWISKKKFTFEQLKKLLDISLDSSHIFYKLWEKDDKAVFKRSFSVLIVALIIYEHREENFLSEETLYEVKNRLIEYMLREQDVRGYVEIEGWAHSAAHTADALDELAQCNIFNKTDLMDILNSIKAKVCIGYYVYIEEESERMVTAIENSINRKLLSNLEIIEWLQGFTIDKSKGSYIENYHLKVNMKGFLRSLYFRFLDREDSELIIDEIKKILKKL